MENSFGLFITLFLGLFFVIRFKQLGEWMEKRSKDKSSFEDKRYVLFKKIMFIIIGSIFFIASLIKLII